MDSLKIFKDKIILVTGGGHGLGSYICKCFAGKGGKVIVNYNKSYDDAFRLCCEINGAIIKADISRYKKVKNMIDTIIKDFGRIDILVNNAGVFKNSLIDVMDEKTWKEVIDVNLSGVFNTISNVSKVMIEQKQGCIINVGSVLGSTGSYGGCNYSASKSGLIGLTKSVALELAKYDIRVNVVSLGYIGTGMFMKIDINILNKIIERIPMKRWGKPEDVAEIICFLASDYASYITGQVINVNGGMYG